MLMCSGPRSSEPWCPSGFYQVSSRSGHVSISWATAAGLALETILQKLTLLSVNLVFRDELQWAAEYSETRESFRWAVIYKFMAQTIPALPTSHLIGPRSLLMFGNTVLVDGLGESRPGRGVLILGSAGEQLVLTLWAHIQSRFEVVFKDFSAKKRTKRHR